MAASRTMWQSVQESKCRLISVATGGESLPSKYQQIKWIVSLQLISSVPQKDVVERKSLQGFVHLAGQNTMKDAYSNSLKTKDNFRRLDFLLRFHGQLYRVVPRRQYGRN